MDVITAKTAGFCFGVKRAVDTVYNELEKGRDIYTYGPVIHNATVVSDMKAKGVKVIESREDLERIKEGTVIIRSHGVEKVVYDILEKKGLNIVDATCPFVLKIHRIVEEEAKKGRRIVVTGDENHPEVRGIISFAGNDVTVIKDAKEAEKYDNPDNKDICIVSQTTFNVTKFKDIVEIFDRKEYSVNVVNTICNATFERQNEARKLARKADCMIVVGDRDSSNSRKLFDICSGLCSNTVFVQTLEDLVSRNDIFSESTACVGITAGASTPNIIIEEVQKYVGRYDI